MVGTQRLDSSDEVCARLRVHLSFLSGMGLILYVEQRSVCVLLVADVGIELACQVSTLGLKFQLDDVSGSGRA